MSVIDSSRLIKARSARSPGPATAFNFDDLRRQCDEHIAQARQQAEQILAAATVQAEEVRQAAHAEGLARGQREGLASAEQVIENRAAEIATRQTQQQLQSVLPAFRAAVDSLQVERNRWLATWEGAAVGLAASIAEKILRHELTRRPELSGDIICEALELAAGQPHVRLRLNSRDLEQLQACGHEALGRLAAVGQAEFIADDGITPGGCVIETRHGVIDAQLETQLARITSELLA
jgi:flagellar assembly protein FliH